MQAAPPVADLAATSQNMTILIEYIAERAAPFDALGAGWMLFIIEDDLAAEIVKYPAILLESVLRGQGIAVSERGVTPPEHSPDFVFNIGIGPSHVPGHKIPIVVEFPQREIAGRLDLDDFIDRLGIKRI